MKESIRNNRIFGLDLLRMFAILFVMHTHGAKFVPQTIAKYYNLVAFDGVGVFFVLSGFLIGGIFIDQMKKKSISTKEIKTFWIKRWTRTLPNYFLFLFITIGIEILSSNNRLTNIELWKYFTFLQNTNHAPASPFFSWSWSLSVEEWFYIILPISIFTLSKASLPIKNALLLYIILLIVIITTKRWINYYSHTNFTYTNFEQLRYSVLYRLDAITFGVLGSFIYKYYKNFWNKYKWFSFYIAIFLLISNFVISKFITYSFAYRIIEMSITSCIILFLLPYLNNIKLHTISSNENNLINKFNFYNIVTQLSLISYSLYLINPLVGDGLTYVFNSVLANIENPPIPWIIIFILFYFSFWCISIILSYFTYNFFEVKTTQYLRKKTLK